ncbi:LuxR C-terminal-related transcriptional regulator, partial [Nocardia sp. NPDC057440]|uniref:LuxR C-terminal-related transcriptional regulator n=1 Tax=Nocardia sp. NPDC057440 TaxID=3346134 RepID=UPI00366D9975
AGVRAGGGGVLGGGGVTARPRGRSAAPGPPAPPPPAEGIDRFLVGLATLTMIAELSPDRPLLCLVDDAQWLDQESIDALLFAVRRFHAESFAVLITARENGRSFSAPGIKELHLSGLTPDAAGQLVAESGQELVLAVRDQVVAEAAGNPLALIELSRALTDEQRIGNIAPLSLRLGANPIAADRVMASFRDRIAALPEMTHLCVLVVAVSGMAELSAVTRAIQLLGASITDFVPAERAGLLEVTPSAIVFRHPLVRAVARSIADVAQRMTAHRALAEVLDGDQAVWHRAANATGPDQAVADELEHAAERAGQRGGFAAASAAYERAASLSVEAVTAGRRYTAAAEGAVHAGQLRRAGILADRAAPLIDAGHLVAALAWVRASVAFERGRPIDAARILLDVAEKALDLESDTFMSLVGQAAVCVWASTADPEQIVLGRRIAELSRAMGGASCSSFALNAILLWRYDDDAPFSMPGPLDDEDVPASARTARAYVHLARGDIEGAQAEAIRLEFECRDRGMAGQLAGALVLLAVSQCLLGAHAEAAINVDEARMIATDTGQQLWFAYATGVAAWLAAVSGDVSRCRALVDEVAAHASGVWITPLAWSDYALTALDLGSRRYDRVLDRRQAAATGPIRHNFEPLFGDADHIEAAVRCGRSELAKRPYARISEWARSTGRDWALAITERCAALLSTGPTAEAHYRRALALHQAEDQPFARARTELLYGEWLRREQRKIESRDHLRTAADTFARLGALPWWERATAELRATGAVIAAPEQATGPLGTLTPQELKVIRLAAAGASNREIGAQLFLSPRTVGYHLYKAFPKLGVTSRNELATLTGALS